MYFTVNRLLISRDEFLPSAYNLDASSRYVGREENLRYLIRSRVNDHKTRTRNWYIARLEPQSFLRPKSSPEFKDDASYLFLQTNNTVCLRCRVS